MAYTDEPRCYCTKHAGQHTACNGCHQPRPATPAPQTDTAHTAAHTDTTTQAATHTDDTAAGH